MTSAISVKNLNKVFGAFSAVNNLSFEVSEHHVVGFLGPNGAGKTTTLRMLVGLSKPTSGNVVISGKQIDFSKTTNNVGYLPELPSFYSWMSGREYLNFIADICKLSKAEKTKRVPELLKLVDLVAAEGKRIGSYSGGMKQRLGIAQALMNDPEVLILDEPVSALDPIGRKDVLSIIEKLKKNRTIIFSTHILSDVDRICDDVIIIDHGNLLVSKPLAELKAEYATAILEIEFTGDATAIAKNVARENWVKRYEQNGNSLKIWLTDNDVVSKNVPLEYFAKQKLGILQYGLKLPETEDLFLELIGGNHA